VPVHYEERNVQVTAFSIPTHPDWQWRIVNYAGEVIEESRDRFSSIAVAVAHGTKRLVEMHVVDRSDPRLVWRSRSPWRRASWESRSSLSSFGVGGSLR
jgi:hypothetical protein